MNLELTGNGEMLNLNQQNRRTEICESSSTEWVSLNIKEKIIWALTSKNFHKIGEAGNDSENGVLNMNYWVVEGNSRDRSYEDD